MKEAATFSLGCVMGLCFLVLVISQFVAGFQGIQHHCGTGWAIAAVVAVFFRFTLPLTVGAFFGAMNVSGWHWLAALCFAVPGLALVIPGVIAALVASLATRGR